VLESSPDHALITITAGAAAKVNAGRQSQRREGSGEDDKGNREWQKQRCMPVWESDDRGGNHQPEQHLECEFHSARPVIARPHVRHIPVAAQQEWIDHKRSSADAPSGHLRLRRRS
jgi:hypothetical protein